MHPGFVSALLKKKDMIPEQLERSGLEGIQGNPRYNKLRRRFIRESLDMEYLSDSGEKERECHETVIRIGSRKAGCG